MKNKKKEVKMKRNGLKKFVYFDDSSKVLKGFILEEDDHSYKIRAQYTNVIIILGKRFIVKISDVKGRF